MARKKRSSSTVTQVGIEPGGGGALRKLYGGYGNMPKGGSRGCAKGLPCKSKK